MVINLHQGSRQTSSLRGGNMLYLVCEGTDFITTIVRVYTITRCGLMAETQAGAAFVSGSNWSCREAAAAVGAYVLEYSLDTVRTKGTFIGTNARYGRIRRQAAVTEFTIRAKF
jgi:hypothetical protein